MSQLIVLNLGNHDTPNLLKVIKEENHQALLMGHATRATDVQAKQDVIGILLSGGHTTSKPDDLAVFDPSLLELGLPILGLGRGMQVIINTLGGTVTPAGYTYDPTPSTLTFHNTKSGIFKNGDKERRVPLGFDAKVSKLPEGFKVLASGEEVKSGDNRPFGAMENPTKNIYGIQFVTQVATDAQDRAAIKNFINLCKEQAGIA